MNDIPEFVVDIEPGAGTTLRLSVQASGLAPIADEVERALPTFAPDDLDRLRSGGASQRVADMLAEQVTRWLLQNDLKCHLSTAFNAAAPFRIVIREHPKVFADLADVPFELIEYDQEPLVLSRYVRAIVHMEKQARVARAPAARAGWPLRVLLVRSNPADLGGKVPPILPLRDRILSLAAARRLGAAVEVTALTSEPGGSGPVTYDALRERLRDQSYGVLVYLGHGDLQDAGFEGLPPIGVLQFELPDSPFANPVRADQIRNELLNHPVSVVVLAGCLTSASEAVQKQLPQWMRGSQSVAEALVYGESGVQCVVGMRYRLETGDADRFLAGFFESLLQRRPGDVEQAVRRGRDDLFAQKRYPPSWSAPVLFRSSGTEPVFAWMRGPPGVIDPLDEHDGDLRDRGWKALASLPLAAPAASRAFPVELLGRIESGFVERWRARGAAVIRPARVERAEGAIARVVVTLEGALAASRLEGRLTFPGALTARSARPAAAFASAGGRAYFALDQQGAAGFLLRVGDGAPAPIPEGALLEIDLEVPEATAAVYEIAVDGLESDPPALLRGWSDAIVLSPP